MTTAEMIYTRYRSPILSMSQLAELLKYKNSASLIDAISREVCKCPTFKHGGRRLAHVSEVARFLDESAAIMGAA